MTKIMIIIDGMTDRPCAELDNLTPFEYADCKHINYMRANGAFGQMHVCPKNFSAESLACILTLLGVPSQSIPTGRAYFEALAKGIAVDEKDLILRCNLVRVKKGILVSSCCENLTDEDLTKAAQSVKIAEDDMRFHHMSSYKNLLIIKNAADEMKALQTFAPHEHIGSKFENLFPAGGNAVQQLSKFINNSMKLLNKNKSNSSVQYAYLPWGQSCKQDIPSFDELHQMSSVSVCATEIVKGLSMAMDMDIAPMQGGTSDTDTNLFNKCNSVLHYIDKKDFILLHINGADEAAHRKNPKEKAAFIRKIDYEIVAPLLYYTPHDTTIMVCSDHSTLSETGAHAPDAQPFTVYRKNQKAKGDIGTFQGIEAIQILKNY